ncbi:SatD family protein [Aestuariibaculum suncheonense]|uniref:Transcriptional regulator n=1 Tax=Aestuariibaculum suncheonense TaxID=1028745 RepID=A0A8J6UAX4_9FLAO|nr:SatD family protein [Aestuariibaculum suncheonense]MBD0835783.1 transcriptional regulator [Aestuariibaculum suncheonense]
MIAVITGDIINSRKGDIESWIAPLKETLNHYGNEPEHWEIYRGDSFQLVLAPEKALLAAIHIKSTIKQAKTRDVRMAIGIGEAKYNASKITESNGPAFVYSGECFEDLKKYTLALKSDYPAIDESLNIMLKLSLLTTNNWSSVVSKVIEAAIEHPEKNQQDLAKLLNRSQSNISEALKRGGYEEIMNMNAFYVKNISKL